MAGDWSEQRRHAVEVHAAEQARRAAAETERATRLVAEFVAAATGRGLRTEPLVARAFSGRARYRTGVRGWYLKPDRSLAVDPDGAFYILAVPASLRARISGAHLTPSPPPLTVGVGARDGESLPLAELLRMRLDAGDNWP